MRFWSAAALDAVAISAFAIIGRRSHGELTDLAGTWHTAWPFLAGGLLGSLAVRAWRAPEALVTGIGVWAGTLIGGMSLRVLSGNTVAVAFVVVAGVTLAVFLLGWRAGLLLMHRGRRRTRRQGLAGSRS
jgi:hypothetical protein